MRLSSLSRLVSKEIGAAEFMAQIRDEFSEHSEGLGKVGGVARVFVTEDQEFILDRSGIGTLCRLFIEGKLTDAELAYIADAMQLADGVGFSDAGVADDVALLTDPEINGPLTFDRALRIANGPPASLPRKA